MTTSLLIKETTTLDIEAFKRPKDPKRLKRGFIAFSGSPRKHWSDSSKVVLVADPYSRATFYYEFKVEDIGYVEKLPNLVSIENEVVPFVRVWVKKGALALRCTPFRVEETV